MCPLTNVAVCLQYDLRNGAIRKKFDSLKYTLKKLEVCVLPSQCRPDRCTSTHVDTTFAVPYM